MLQATTLGLVAVGGTVVALTREPRRQVIALGVYGMLLTILFMVLQAPDVALSELAVGTAALPLMLLVTLATISKPPAAKGQTMSDAARRRMFLAAAVPLALLLLRAVWGLPGFGHYPGPYGDVINTAVLTERHVANAVTAVNFDYRGLDTLGEEFILFAAVTGVVLLLRTEEGEKARVPARAEFPPGDAVRWLGRGLTGLTVTFGLYMILHPQPSPGGGFQGGAMAGTATLLIYLASDYRSYRGIVRKEPFDFAESIGAGGYALVGVGTLLAGGAFLQNLLPLGQPDSLRAGGTIPLINFAVGVEVAAGFAVLFLEFLKQLYPPPPGQEGDD